MAWMVGVDVGGTFTDFYAFDDESKNTVVHKIVSTPDNPADAIIEGLRTLASEHNVPVDAMARLAHGTTVGTNAFDSTSGPQCRGWSPLTAFAICSKSAARFGHGCMTCSLTTRRHLRSAAIASKSLSGLMRRGVF